MESNRRREEERLEAFRHANRDRRAAEIWDRLEMYRIFRERTAGTSAADLECGAVEELMSAGELLSAQLVLEYFESFLEEAGE